MKHAKPTLSKKAARGRADKARMAANIPVTGTGLESGQDEGPDETSLRYVHSLEERNRRLKELAAELTHYLSLLRQMLQQDDHSGVER